MNILVVGRHDEEINRFTGENAEDYKTGEKFHIDEINGNWVVERLDGKFWAIVGNEDEVFSDINKAFEWVATRVE